MENNKIKFDTLDKEEAAIVEAVVGGEFSSAGDADNRVVYWQSALKETMKRKIDSS